MTRNLKLAYGEIAAETVPERFEKLLRQLDGEDDDDKGDEDPGIVAEPPPRPKGGPQSSSAEASLQSLPEAHDGELG